MNLRWLGAAVLMMAAAPFGTAQSRIGNTAGEWRAFISGGYQYCEPAEIRGLFDDVLQVYRAAGVPVEAQVPFKTTMVFRAGVGRSSDARSWYGLSAGIWRTPAFARYRDYAGSVDITGSIETMDLSFFAKRMLSSEEDLPVILGIEPGITYGTSRIHDGVHFKNMPSSDHRLEWNTESWGYSVLTTVGTMVPFGHCALALEAGYRFLWNTSGKQTIVWNGDVNYEYRSVPLGQKGITVQITLWLP